MRFNQCASGFQKSEFFRGTCVSCGKADHSLLKIKVNKDGYKSMEYLCPVTEGESVDLNNRDNMYLRCGPSPELLALHHGYNPTEVEEAIHDYATSGLGRIHPHRVGELRKSVLMLCEEVRSSWTFKRQLPSTEEDSSDDEELSL